MEVGLYLVMEVDAALVMEVDAALVILVKVGVGGVLAVFPDACLHSVVMLEFGLVVKLKVGPPAMLLLVRFYSQLLPLYFSSGFCV